MSEGRRFRLLRRLGAGAHGEVYLAEQESQAGFRRRVALKLLRPELGHHDQAARRMRDEARILGRLSHRHIVGVSDLVRLQERWAVVMDYVPGADLERVLEALAAAGEQFPVRAAFDVAVAVLRALHAAWIVDNGTGSPLHLIHRDIKPSNVLLAEDGALKVLDFGVARVDLGTREAETGAVRPGTLRYMAPERLLGEEESPSGDVYATAVSVFELLIGEPLGRTPIIDPKHTAYVEGAVQRAKERAPDDEVLAQAVGILAAAMAAEPDDRPSASDLARDLAGLIGRLPGEDVHAFASRFMPRITELLGDTSEPVEGTLKEASSASNATFLQDAGDDASFAAADVEQAPPSGARLGLIGVGIGLLVGVALLCVAGGVVTTMWSQGSGTAAVDPDTSTEVVATTDPDADGDGDVEADSAGTTEASTDDSDAAADTDADEGTSDSGPETDGSTAGVSSGGASETGGTTSGGTTTGGSRTGGTSSGGSRTGGGTTTTAPPEIDPDAPRVSAAMFVMPEASSLRVRCGDVDKVGTASVRLSNLPAGSCSVTAAYLGKELTTQVEVTSRREVRCAIEDGSLRCR